MPIIFVDDSSQVRAVIDTTLDADDLPDDLIMLPVYAGRADRWVYAQVPDADLKTGDDARRIKDAAILYLSALLIPSVPLLQSEQFPEYQYMRPRFDPAKKQAQLIADAEDLLAPFYTDLGLYQRHFTVAKGNRGRL